MNSTTTVARQTARATWTRDDAGNWVAQTRDRAVQPGDLIVVAKKDRTLATMRAVAIVRDYGPGDVMLWTVS